MSGAQRLAPGLVGYLRMVLRRKDLADLRPVHQVGRAQDGDVVLSALGRIEVKIPVLGAYYRGSATRNSEPRARARARARASRARDDDDDDDDDGRRRRST